MTLPIYLINLDGSHERLASASSQLDAAGLSFERVAAFDGRGRAVSEFPDYDAKATLHNMGRPLRGGEIGCYLSHLECARRFVATGADFALVLEDDMQLTLDAAQVLKHMQAWLQARPVDWDLINLGPNKLKISTPLRKFDSPDQSYLLARAHYFPVRLTGLLWSRVGATTFVEQHRRIFAPVDNYFQHWLTRSDRGLAVWPPLLIPTGVASDINQGSTLRRSDEGRHPFYFAIKHRRLLTEKVLALRHKLTRALNAKAQATDVAD